VAPKRKILSTMIAFDVVYEDGSRSSNRRVHLTALSGLDGDEPARAIIEEQDREIALASGRPRGAIKSLTRAAVRAPARE